MNQHLSWPSAGDPHRTPGPFLTQPFEAAVTGWVVVFGAVLAELVGGAVTNQMSNRVAAAVLVIPVVVAFGFATAQWWQVRTSASDPANWWHMTGIAAAVFAWLLWPTTTGVFATSGASAAAVCAGVPTGMTTNAECLRRAGYALAGHHLTWWATLVVILIAALLARRSRIAAWAAIPAAFAGCELATHFFEQFIVFYHLS